MPGGSSNATWPDHILVTPTVLLGRLSESDVAIIRNRSIYTVCTILQGLMFVDFADQQPSAAICESFICKHLDISGYVWAMPSNCEFKNMILVKWKIYEMY